MKKKKLISLVLSGILILSAFSPMTVRAEKASAKADQEAARLEMWYDKPANGKRWISNSTTSPNDLQPLTIGNGYMGAAFYGNLQNEKIQLSEKTIWKSGPNSRPDYDGGNKTGGNKLMPEFRDAAFEYDQKTVDNIMKTGLLYGKGPNWRGAYQTFGNLNLKFEGQPSDVPSDYRRYLDLERAIGGVEYTYDNVTYTREYFVNYPNNIMAFRLSASEAKKLNLTVNLDPLKLNTLDSNGNETGAETKVNIKKEIEGTDTLTLTANLKSNDMKIASRMKVLNEGGELIPTADKDIQVKGADSVVILLTIGTDYKNEWPDYVGEDPLPKVIERINAAAAKGYDTLKEEHIADYEELFGTVDVDFGQFDNGKPTNELLREYQNGFKAKDLSDNKYRELEALAFQFGRYALISSSRTGTLPANLQGVWNDNNSPMWSSDYHLNVNLEMNYWPAMITNLDDTMIALIDYLESLRAPGRVTAKEYLGIEDGGWTANCSNNVFGYTCPHDNYSYAVNPASPAWLCANIYDYYMFTGDVEMLRDRIYPIMKEAAQALSKLLVEDPRDGTLVIAPSFSSEHGPMTVGTTYEQSLTYQLFENVIESSRIVGDTDAEFINMIAAQKERLDPLRIGEWGQIKEWREEDIVEIGELTNASDGGYPKHRHISHLLGLYPLFMITPETPDEFAAARVSLADRGNGNTGWSRAHKMNAWARLLDGTNAMDCYSGILAEKTLSNLFDTHPPLQIDGTFGLTAGVGEMLLQSHAGYVQPIPALPKEWKTGSFEGLKARGNFEVDAVWEDNALTSLTVLSNKGNTLKLRYNGIAGAAVTDAQGTKVTFTVEDNNTISFPTTEGKTYKVVMNEKHPSQYQAAAPSERENPVPTTGTAAYTIPAGFKEIGKAERELPVTRVVLEGNDGADIRMYYDSALGDLSFNTYQLPAKDTKATIQVTDKETGEAIAQQLADVKNYGGFKADFSVPANLNGTYEVQIRFNGAKEYVSRTFTLEAGKDVFDITSLTQEYERTKGLMSKDYTDESWTYLQATRANAKAVLDAGGTASLQEMTTLREQMAYAREGLKDRTQVKVVAASDSTVGKEGGWTISGGKATSTTVGDTLTIPFYGEGITIMAKIGQDCGKTEVYLDGELQKTVDLFCMEGASSSTDVYKKKELPMGDHTLTLKHVGARTYATADNVVINQFNVDAPAKGTLVTGDNLLLNKPASATHQFNDTTYSAAKAVDGNAGTRWATQDNTSPTITFDLQGETSFNYLVIKEASGFTNRVGSYVVEANVGGEWKQLASGGGVGSSLGIDLPETTAAELRIAFTPAAAAGVTLSEVELYSAHYDTGENTAQSVADALVVYQPQKGADKMVTSVVPAGYTVAMTSSDNEEIVSLDGKITTPETDTDVTVTYTITDQADATTATKTVVVTVKADSVLTVEEVADRLSVRQLTATSTVLIPSVLPSGYSLEIVSTSDEAVIDKNGTVYKPEEDKSIDVTYRVTKLEDGTTAERTLTIVVPGKRAENETEEIETDHASVNFSTEVAPVGTTGVSNKWFYQANAADQGGKVAAYKWTSGDAPTFDITFEGEEIVVLSRKGSDQYNLNITVYNEKNEEVASGIAVCQGSKSYRQEVYKLTGLEPGRYTLHGEADLSSGGPYAVVDGFIVSGRKPVEIVDADRTALNAVIEKAAKIIKTGKLEKISYEHKVMFMNAYNDLLIVRDDMLAEQAQIDNVTAEMQKVIEMFGDKTALQTAMNEADSKLSKPQDYDPSAIDELEKAMAKAMEVLENEAALKDEIDAAVKALTEATAAMEDHKKDWAGLENAVSEGSQIMADIEAGLYVENDALNVYKDLYQKAEELLKLENRIDATKEQVEEMIERLGEAALNLELKDEKPEPEVTLKSISVENPKKTEYVVGDELDLTGLKVTAEYSDGNTKELKAGDYEVSGFDSATAGEKTVTVTYEGQKATFKVTVKETEKPEVILKSISVEKPKKTEYKIGDELDLTGLKVTAEYSDGSTKGLKAGDYKVSGFDSETAGEKTVTVTYEGQKATFKVTVKETEKSEADKTELKKLVKLAEGINLNEYAKEGQDAFKKALKAAKDVLADKKVAQKEVNKATSDLKSAINNLKKVLLYTDVNKDDWHYNAVYYNYLKGTMTGLDKTHFGPDETLARAQFAVILHRMNGSPDMEFKNIFPDVIESEGTNWYVDAVLWANKTGIVKGYTDTGMFGPADNINREQMAVMMYRYAKYKKYDVSVKADYSRFEDAGSVNEFAKEAMQWAFGNKIITGKYNETVIDPQGNATRAECATIIQRFMEKYEK